ncbi:unnamed protein product [Leptidea sinapis]|uniref:Lipase n=1 Tax=Leptidea sinapis TaxID=189913 RepID=A0A5E4QU84_9NEOP|nr:unnamed protein product [Leptidea sinapis]
MSVTVMLFKRNIALDTLILVVVLIIVNIIRRQFNSNSLEIKRFLGYDSDLLLNFTQLANKYGYSSEEHTVVTEDGYLLKVFRIKNKKCEARVKQPPLLLMHGVLQSSDAWFDASPGTGLAYLLADECFDAWVGNQRGNYYARRHLTLNPDKDSSFWDFSVDQIGYYDVPATIDYVLSNMRVKKLNYIGYSQGAGTFFVMCSERPEYCKKTSLLIGLSPATRLKHTKSKPFRSILNILSTCEGLLAQLKINELFAKESFLQVLVEFICQIRLFSEPLCENFLYGFVDSSHPGSITHETLSMLYSHIAGGTSLRNMARYGQSLNADDFQKYDFGETVNVVKYGSKKPPGYNLSSVSLPVVIIYGANDHLVDTKDISWLVDKLPNVIGLEEVADPLWNHLDTMFSQHINKTIWPTVNRYLKRFSETYMKTKS